MMTLLDRRYFTKRLFGTFLAGAAAGWSELSAKPDTNPGTSSTGFVYHSRYLDHIIYKQHPESPQRLIAIVQAMKKRKLDKEVTALPPIKNPEDYIPFIHTQEHREKIDTIPVTGAVAKLAVAGALSAVKAVDEGAVKNAFCAIRPPGHHAGNTGRMEGFCYYNNVAIAARYAQKVLNHKKILIIDWDYHHGNGTETAFYDDPDVLFFSTHDKRAYPGAGSPKRKGAGPGTGYTINVHLGCGTTDREMIKAWETALLPKLETFSPDFVLISAGFDSRKDDPLGCFAITDTGFFRMTRMAKQIAEDHCNGRLVSLLEGGYNTNGLARAVCAHLEALRE
ncbi:MAG: histone deacetylase [Chitinivibrionales bacterium]|nr:histone deacetylase [Chitinivibrionales bacterium]